MKFASMTLMALLCAGTASAAVVPQQAVPAGNSAPPSHAGTMASPAPALTPSHDWAQGEPVLGQHMSGFVSVAGHRMPLPAGDWQVVSFNNMKSDKAATLIYGIGLIQTQGKLLQAVAELTLSATAGKETSPITPACATRDVIMHQPQRDKITLDCSMVIFASPSLWQTQPQSMFYPVSLQIKRRGLKLPATMVGTVVHLHPADRPEEIVVFHNPDFNGTGAPFKTKGWTMEDFKTEPAKMQYVGQFIMEVFKLSRGLQKEAASAAPAPVPVPMPKPAKTP
jgi:hypothetical protein